jgi:hypothetical protein
MKIRHGFVSNSSSSSFIISKYYLSQYQIDMIENHIKEAKNIAEKIKKDNESFEECEYILSSLFDYGDQWYIHEEEDHVRGYTYMDNFDMDWFLRKIGVNIEKVKWSS